MKIILLAEQHDELIDKSDRILPMINNAFASISILKQPSYLKGKIPKVNMYDAPCLSNTFENCFSIVKPLNSAFERDGSCWRVSTLKDLYCLNCLVLTHDG